MKQISDEIIGEVINIRRKLHQIPELGFNEFKTSKFIKDKLKDYGYDFEEILNTGIIAYKKGESNKKSIAFRADMDGLVVYEKTKLNYKSLHPDKMHACGHDGHMAILLGLCKYFSKLDKVNRDIVFIFQPAEEGPGGARLIVEEGYIEKYNIGAVFGLHIYPGIEEGKVGIKKGPLMAQNGEIDIDIYGKSSHGGIPNEGIDAIIIASQAIDLYQSIISRNINPLEGSVLTIGKIEGGQVRNAIASHVRLEGTIRAFNSNIYDLIKKRILEINKGMEKAFACKIDTEIRDFYPPVINDEKLYALVKEALVNEYLVDVKAMMISEDFSYYQEVVPGFFILLGSKNQSRDLVHPLHSCYFNFNEDILVKGVKSFIDIYEKFNT